MSLWMIELEPEVTRWLKSLARGVVSTAGVRQHDKDELERSAVEEAQLHDGRGAEGVRPGLCRGSSRS